MPDDQKKQTERDERHLTAATAGKMPLRAAISQLYGYIYCMLVSNILVGMPLFGGVLYLCGKAVLVTVQVFSRKNRKYLPLYSRVWVILLITILMLIGFLLTGIYPARFESEKLWIMYAAVALCLCCEGMAGRRRRLSAESGGPMSDRAWVLTILLQAAFTGAMAVVLITQLGWNDGWPPAAGFALMAAILIASRGKMGFGDAMLAMGIGAFMGLKMTILALYLGFLAGGITVLPLLIAKKVTRKTAVPFAPFLFAGMLAAMFFGKFILLLFGFSPSWPWL